ncbi:MAG TPA: hypothetical protein VN229_03395 [Terriglobales bacterium]|nr:hypothetical protein [Terriglobales bacterium]
MRSLIRSLVLLYLIGMGVYFVPALHNWVWGAYQSVADYFDKRPVQTVLIFGNSRAYFNNMPVMVRDIADAANSPVRYAITTRMWPSATLADHWNNADDQALLKQHWDRIIIQAESGAQSSEDARASFRDNGGKLIAAALATHSPVALIINWAYAPEHYVSEPAGSRDYHIELFEDDHRNLARATGASVIDTCRAWEVVRRDAPAVQLYFDDNHPAVAGSFLSALMIYGFISRSTVAPDGYHPDGVDDAGNKAIRAAVREISGGGES